jgi:hypothetical protein
MEENNLRLAIIPNEGLEKLGWEQGPNGFIIFLGPVDDEGRISPILAFPSFEKVVEFSNFLLESKSKLEAQWEKKEADTLNFLLMDIDTFLISKKLDSEV